MEHVDGRLQKLRSVVDDIFEGELECVFLSKNEMTVKVVKP